LEYKGHTFLNLVDCVNPNLLNLPGHVDILASAFAGGAGSFPCCWEGMLGEATCDQYSDNKNKKLIMQIQKWIVQTQPRLYIPFAGYFVEAPPDMQRRRRLNVKNSPEGVISALQKSLKDKANCSFWAPAPGEVLDVKSLEVTPSEQSKKLLPPDHGGLKALDAELEGEMDFQPLQSMAGVEAYFKWAAVNYKDDLILHIIEQDLLMTQTIREYFFDARSGKVSVDFPSNASKPTFLGGPGATNPRYLRMQVPSCVMRHTMRLSIQWDVFNVGFQFLGVRQPNIFNKAFWDYFGYHLPKTPMKWAAEFDDWKPTPKSERDRRTTALLCAVATGTAAMLVAGVMWQKSSSTRFLKFSPPDIR